MRRILITGAAGFIGYHLTLALINNPENDIIGIDNINNYYDKSLKLGRLNALGILLGKKDDRAVIQSEISKNFRFKELDINHKEELFKLFNYFRPDVVVNLAAQAGVRYSLSNPEEYILTNIVGFFNIVECSRDFKVSHLLYASSSSVYGLNNSYPFRESDPVDHPISTYSFSKRSNELLAHTYSHLFNLPTTGLRFFTVYGPWGRPDMALYSFTDSIINRKEIELFNNGEMYRDFTYVDDIVKSINLLIDLPPRKQYNDELMPNTSSAPFRVLNIGSGKPIALTDFVIEIEQKLGITAKIKLVPMQPGDVISTYADTTALRELIKFSPMTQFSHGVSNFVDWYLSYHKLS
jgi:UDP-glucuronate 4-epimerase